MARATGANAKFYVVRETTYGVKPASGFTAIPFNDVDLSSSQELEDSGLLGQGREAQDPTLGPIAVTGAITVPVDLRNIGLWLELLLGDPVTVDNTGVYTHTFKSGGATLPSFAAETQMPEVPEFAMVLGGGVNGFDISMARSGEPVAKFDLLGQNEIPAATTQIGVADAPFDLTRFGAPHGGIYIDGALAANVTAGSFNFSNGLDAVETIRDDGLIDGIDPGQATASGSITARFADRILLDKAVAGTPVAIKYLYKIDNDNLLEVVFHRVFLPRPKKPISGPGGIEVNFAWQASRSATESTMMTVTLINDVAAY